MDSWPRVALLVDVAAAAELCERLDDSLLGCLQLVRELQSESGGRDVALSYSLFDSTRDLDQRQLQAFTRQQSYRAHHHHQHARVKSDVVCMSSWQAWDMSAWAKFRKNVLATVSLCGKDMESIASPMKRAVGHDENRANGSDAAPELPLICRCLSAVNTSGCKSNLYMCVIGMFPSVGHVWREWAGIPRPTESVSAELITAQLSSHVQHTEPQWRFVECRPQSGVQAVLQASSTHGAVQLFACSATAKGLLYDQLCAHCFVVAPTTTATQPTGAAMTATTANSGASHTSLQLSLNGFPDFACRGDWRPIRRKTVLQRLAMYSAVEASKLEHCCPQPLGKLRLDGVQLRTPMLSWVGTLYAAKLAAVGVAVHEGSELPVWLLPVSATELQVALIRVGSGQTPLLINAIKQSAVFASNSTLLSLMRPPPHVAASLATTTKRAPLQPQPQLHQSESTTLKPRMSRGSSLLRRSDSVLSAAGDCDRSLLEEADDVDEALQAIDAALNAEDEAAGAGEQATSAGGLSDTLNLLEDADFARELGSHVQTRLQDGVWATCADAVESCILRGQLDPLELAQTLAMLAPMDKAGARRMAEAISSLYEPIAKKFMGRCSVAERALLARCSILQLLFLFESALAGEKPGKGKAQGVELSKTARRHASHAIVKLATNLNAPGFESSKMLFAAAGSSSGSSSSSTTNADLSSVQSVCSYLQQRYGDKLTAAVEEICSEVDDSFSKPRADLPSKLPEQPAVKGRPSKLRLLPEGGENGDDDRQSSIVGGLPPFLLDDQDTRDSNCCSVLPAGSDTNMSDSISKVRKRLFEDAAPQSAPQTEVRSRRSYPPSARSKLPAAAAEATCAQEPVKLQELISRSTVAARGGFAASRQQVGAYQVLMAPKAAMQQSKLKRSHSVPTRGRELLARSQVAAIAAAAQIVQQSPPVENQQPSTVAETPLIKRRRS